ncbi:unnamed protein product [Closterium sp. Naga37s-1]|nr:unnamed protein product [Closterium sp. Naga37s-1]
MAHPKGSRSKAPVDVSTANAGVPPAPDAPLQSESVQTTGGKEFGAADNDAVAGGSGLSVAENAKLPVHGGADEILLDDEDSDDEMLVDLEKETESRLRTTVILLIPFSLNTEIVLQPAYIAKTRYCRLQLSFTLPDDAAKVTRKEVVYQRLNGHLVKLYWQHTEHAGFAREKACNPQAVEVVLKGVSASVDL